MAFNASTITQQQIKNDMSQSGLSAIQYVLSRSFAVTREDEVNQDEEINAKFAPYQLDPIGYIRDFYGFELWSSQVEIVEACLFAVRQMIEKRDYEAGILSLENLEHWKPGQPIQNWILIDAGHIVGKTFILGFIGKWFYDCFAPSITYCISPNTEHLSGVLFKEIKRGRENRDDLRGTTYKISNKLWYASNHFVKGIALNDSSGLGTTRVQGQHEKYQLIIIDEAEAAPDYIFEAAKTMTHGNVSLVLTARNPESNTCSAHKLRRKPNSKAFTISCFDHPNIITGKTVIPESVTRSYIEEMCEDFCDIVREHNVKQRTFELFWKPGVIYQPHSTFMWRVWGLVPDNVIGNTFCSIAAYDHATTDLKIPPDIDKTFAFFGVDVARYGNDAGAIYLFYGQTLEKIGSLYKQDSIPYYEMCKEEALALKGRGVERVEVRVDGGGGYGGGPIDALKIDIDLREAFTALPVGKVFDGVEVICIECGHSEWQVLQNQKALCTNCQDTRDYNPGFRVLEVLNNSVSTQPKKFADTITQLYSHAGAALESGNIQIIKGSDELKYDLTERTYEVVKKTVGRYNRVVRRIMDKEAFKKKRKGHLSPDDGDGAVLALAPSSFFRGRPEIAGSGDSRQNRQRNESREQQKRGLQRGGIRGRDGFTSRDNGRRWSQ